VDQRLRKFGREIAGGQRTPEELLVDYPLLLLGRLLATGYFNGSLAKTFWLRPE
jgi:hypothetical protein